MTITDVNADQLERDEDVKAGRTGVWGKYVSSPIKIGTIRQKYFITYCRANLQNSVEQNIFLNKSFWLFMIKS